MNSACDWGVSDPLAVVKCGLEMRKRHYSADFIETIVFENPKRFLSQSDRFRI
jgi:predicted metal-dependent TIM-barrel fold hydrolase